MVDCGPKPSAATAYRESVAAIEAPFESARRGFDRAAAGANRSEVLARARAATSAAFRARDLVEALRIPPSLENARREELIFLNHAALGFQAFAQSPASPAELEKLRSILRRGRAHQQLGRRAVSGIS